jgi:NAD+ synthase (glutamine-hydrolysing)
MPVKSFNWSAKSPTEKIPMAALKIAGATLNQTPLDWQGNLERIQEAIQLAKSSQVEVLCLPELSLTGYGAEDLFLSPWFCEKALAQLERLLPFCQGITIAVGLPLRIEDKVYNVMAVVEDTQVKGLVAKQFLAIDGVHYEFRWFTPWPAQEQRTLTLFGKEVLFGDLTFQHKGLHYGFEICEDAWRGDLRPGHRLSERKVDLIFNPSASHFAMGKTSLRQQLVTESSRQFSCFYCYVNLLGNEAGKMIYDGEILFAKDGTLLSRNALLSFKDVQILSFQVEPIPQSIAPILSKEWEFAQATGLALFDYLRKSKSKGFVLSLSGGADSSTLAILVAEMVRRGIQELGTAAFASKLGLPAPQPGAEEEKDMVQQLLTTAYQSTKNSSKETLLSAKALAESIGATFYTWSIDEEVNSYTQKIEKATGQPLTWEEDDITLQNIQARTRSPIIWMLANKKNALLLATSNRSEGDVGYATMDGDTSGSISPIAGVDKDFIRHWLRWAENHLDRPGLRLVNALTPTAELRPSEQVQTDENDLMPYGLLVKIERLALQDRQSPVAIFLHLRGKVSHSEEELKGFIKKFFQLWSLNQWKRERLAPSFHLDEFNIDPKTWCRFPILSGGFKEELEQLEKQ